MKTNNLYIIWANPREDSLTANIVKEMNNQAIKQGIEVTNLDLYRCNFDPVLREEDEPEWENPTKQYSAEVRRLFAELDNKDTIVIVFPVWWYSFPAILKGYFERVWNYGLAYGEGSKLKVEKIRFVALVGGTKAGFLEYGWEQHMTDYVMKGMHYLQVNDIKIDFLYNTIGLENVDEDHYQRFFEQARNIISELV
ncbi:NAD(P)H oxidoreductase [Gilliamella sp. Pra-s65]|uniref:NAD(P)H oxidoreductase n=1 Tax=unclassified Gilliamella TaxID=2685620 RepID=UPI00136627C0|nr:MULTISPECIES: NAD(P)H oxidoreductase [unclassified Gilliamella]MWN90498.1 NAD(P)H oxidoreductase [Gilliamella sp. Pra-s65]MWP47492.1 NAD(P)H oxidoreductase [Gilliamella sp. Pas-s27]MWP73513.1 NAD(P)H oxidoreductase [Gilliamella sp. Pra-s52]